MQLPLFLFFFFNDTATTEIYTLSLHDALPIFVGTAPTATVNGLAVYKGELYVGGNFIAAGGVTGADYIAKWNGSADRKSTRLNSSHGYISYAVFCLKKKKKPI